MKSGIVMDVKKKHSIVLTSDGEYLKVKNRGDMFSSQKILFTSEDIINNQGGISLKSNTNLRKFSSIAAALLIMVLIAGTFFTTRSEAFAYVNVDINPSVRLVVDSDSQVIKAIALNDDAQTLDLKSLKGLEVTSAIENIVSQAKDNNFIEEDSEDYVLVTTVAVKEGSENLDKEIEEKISQSEELKNVNVAQIKATKVEMREAEGKKVPLGLLVVNGQVGDVSVKEFFKAEGNKELFTKVGKIKEKEKNEEQNIDQDEEQNQEQNEEQNKQQEKATKMEKNMELVQKFVNKLEQLQSQEQEVVQILERYNAQIKDNQELTEEQVTAFLREVQAIYEKYEIEDADEQDQDQDQEQNKNQNGSPEGKGRSLEKEVTLLKKFVEKLKDEAPDHQYLQEFSQIDLSNEQAVNELLHKIQIYFESEQDSDEE